MRKIKVLTMVVLSVVLSSICLADTFSVGKGGWEDFDKIQNAIDSSWHGDVIEVSPGIYYEQVNFKGMAITVKSINPSDPNIVKTTIIDPNTPGDYSVYSVHFVNGETGSSKCSGFTIQGGFYGMYCHGSSPTIDNCAISHNGQNGIFGELAEPTITNCIISHNGNGINNCDGIISQSIISDHAAHGLYFCDGSITGCTIRNNVTHGLNECRAVVSDCLIVNNGNMGANKLHGTIQNCLISGNGTYALYDCTGNIFNCIIYNNNRGICNTRADIINCLISGNRNHGIESSKTDIVNCTIIGNEGYGFYCNGSYNTTIKNCLIINNLRYGIFGGTPVPVLEYNNVWHNHEGNYDGMLPGITDISTNPYFAQYGYWDNDLNWVEGDYHLKSTVGRYDPNNTWVTDDVNSPCIDAGDPADDFDDEPLPNGARINMGAYGGTSQASKSLGLYPSAVENLAIMGGYEQINLNWEVPSDIGSTNIVNYKIYRGPARRV